MLIDKDLGGFSVALLREWKSKAEQQARQRLLRAAPLPEDLEELFKELEAVEWDDYDWDASLPLEAELLQKFRYLLRRVRGNVFGVVRLLHRLFRHCAIARYSVTYSVTERYCDMLVEAVSSVRPLSEAMLMPAFDALGELSTGVRKGGVPFHHLIPICQAAVRVTELSGEVPEPDWIFSMLYYNVGKGHEPELCLPYIVAMGNSVLAATQEERHTAFRDALKWEHEALKTVRRPADDQGSSPDDQASDLPDDPNGWPFME